MAAHDLPAARWSRKLSATDPAARVHTFSRPPALEALQLLPVAARVGSYIYNEHQAGREPIFDLNGIMLEPPTPGPFAGVPLGGIGAGCIGRGYRGEMRRWSVHPGRYIHREIHTNQFVVRVKRGDAVISQVLSVSSGAGADPLLRGWAWGVPASRVESHALFPRSWLVFREPVPGINIVIEQVSPVIPHCYSDTSSPTCVFVVRVENLDPSTVVEMSVMFTMQNCDGTDDDPGGGYAHAPFSISAATESPSAALTVDGVCMARHRNVSSGTADQGSMSIAAPSDASVSVSVCGMFTTNVQVDGVTDAKMLWDVFCALGELSTCTVKGTSVPGATVASAVCSHAVVGGGDTVDFPFALSWDHPMARFGGGGIMPKFYTRFFGRSGLASPSIASFSLFHFEDWRKKIVAWQLPINSDESLPEYYRHMLFNELYFLVDGGTIWLDTTAGVDNLHDNVGDALSLHVPTAAACPCPMANLLSAVEKQRELCSSLVTREHFISLDKAASVCEGNSAIIGQFLYLEGHEYLMYNTYDVHFYAGFALLMLWPQLEHSLQRDFAGAVAAEDLTARVMLGEGGRRPRKVAGCIPHDLGSPSEEPFKKTNIYNFQDVSVWKDLPPKFVLQIYRNYKYSGALGLMRDVYPVVVQVMEQALLFDRDNDGMIENEGFPDQTYDIWTASGVHAYCGGLWTAACFATAEIAKIIGDLPTHIKFTEIGDSARHVFQQELWNGVYFDYDNSKSAHHDSIMADMLAGQWYCRVCSLPPIASVAQAVSCYRTIFNLNVLRGGDGFIGAINGMRPNGAVDKCCLQSREVWTGTTYALSAAMLLEARVVEMSMSKADVPELKLQTEPQLSSAAEEVGSGEIGFDLDFCFDETLNIGFGEDKRRPMKKKLLRNPLKFHKKDVVDRAQSRTIKDQLSSDSGRAEVVEELRRMGYQTAQGVHDGGWQQFGYWFATPEAWESNGNYRSLGYMRPLAIWAMQYGAEMDKEAALKNQRP